MADLEIRIRDAHSVWAWDVGTQAWQGYSPKLRRDVLISRELGTPRLQRKLDSGQGLWVYLEKPIEVLFEGADEDVYKPKKKKEKPKGLELFYNEDSTDN